MRPRALESLAAAVSLVLLAGVAGAQDASPVIRELQLHDKRTTSLPLGYSATVVGRNFHACPPLPEPQPGQPAPRNDCRHEELTVELNHQKVPVLAVDLERVTFNVPQDTPVGRRRLRIAVRGRGEATLDLEVTAQPTPEQLGRQADMEGPGSGRQPDLEERIRDEFKITMFELKRDAAGVRFDVAGVAGKVPDGFTMVISLGFETPTSKRDIEQRLTTITNTGGQGQFRATFGPFPGQVLFGTYAATCLFELGKQPKVKARDFRSKLKREEAEVYDRIERREYLMVGTPQEAAEQTEAMKNHYKAHCDELARLLTEVEKAYASGCRQHFKQQGQANYDEKAWLEYVVRMGFVAAEDQKALDAFKADLRFSSRNGHFKPDDYQTWAQDTFLPALTAAFRRHREFRDATIAPIEPRGELPADYLVSIVLESFKDYTRNLYERSKLELPEALRNVQGVDPVPAQTITRRFFDAQRRLLLRTVGLRHLAPGND
ncbi:MAG: hypothetical protein KIT58_02290 [Planctomycetota bacterium]|nr:hypothetical protein [Planctomycetota bacterium]